MSFTKGLCHSWGTFWHQVNWPWTPPKCTQSRSGRFRRLQRFLGFANYYRRFIKGYSATAAPLHALTSSKVKFMWSPVAEEAFQLLKERFTTAPILTLPDPDLLFVVEVEASSSGMEAVLSQRSAQDNKVHPSFPGVYHRQSKTTMLGTMSSWLSRWPSRSGGTGWKEQNTPFRF